MQEDIVISKIYLGGALNFHIKVKPHDIGALIFPISQVTETERNLLRILQVENRDLK